MFDSLPYHLQGLGYLGIYLSLALGIMGIPIPDEALMTYLGFLVYSGQFRLEYALLFSFLGSITGMSFNFFIGRGIMGPLAVRLGKKFNKGYERYRSLFDRYGSIIIVVGYFFPIIRHLTAYSSGLLKMRYDKFLTLASLGSFIWVTVFISLGYNLGQDWPYINEIIGQYRNLAIVFFLFSSVSLLFFFGRKIR